jgi:ATP-dependent Lon protease
VFDICSQLDIKKNQYKLSNELIEYIITTYTEDEGGVRSLKKILFNIFSKLNLLNLTKHDKNIKYSFDLDNKELENNEITKEIIDKFIKNNSKDDDLYYKNWYA